MVKGRCQDKCSTYREPFNLEKDKDTLVFIYLLSKKSKKYFLTFLDELDPYYTFKKVKRKWYTKKNCSNVLLREGKKNKRYLLSVCL